MAVLRTRCALPWLPGGSLESRVPIEQAKGAIAEALAIDVDEAFDLLRNDSRNTNQVLREVARAVVAHSLRIAELRSHDS